MIKANLKTQMKYRKSATIMLLIVLLVLGVGTVTHHDIPIDQMKARWTNEQSKFINLDGVDVHYRDEGNGHPIILIHGTASSLHTWEAWTDGLKETHRVIRMDIPAFGLTGPNLTRDYSIESYVAFIHEFLNQLEIDSCVIAGNSLGGNIAWNYALEYPDRISKLILLNASGLIRDDEIDAIFKLARLPIVGYILTKVTPRSLVEGEIKEVYFNDELINRDLIDRYHQMTLREGNRQAFIDRAYAKHEDRSKDLNSLSTETLIIWGEYDYWIPVKYAYQFNELIPNSQLVILESGHVPMEENPKESLDAVLGFLYN